MFHNIWVISRNEIKLLFVSFIAYIILFIFLVFSGIFFYRYFNGLHSSAELIIPYYLKYFLSFISFLLTPFITMRAFSEEKKTGTIELLLTSPLKESEIVLGKFVGTFLFYMVYVVFTFFYLGIVMLFIMPDFGRIIPGYLGFILLEATYISVGLLISVTTKNQIVSGLVTLIVLFCFWLFGGAIAPRTSGILREIFEYLSFMKHFEDFTKGIVDTKHIIFFISVISLNLFWTIRLLENRKVIN